MNTQAPAVFNFNSNEVRTVTIDDTVWFVAKDVCDALGYQNSRSAVADHLDEDERSTVANPDGRNGGGNLTIINESGLYALVLRSRKPEARKFAKWVTSEVLPAIRKTGTYSSLITVAQQGELATLIAERFPDGKHRPYAWSRFNNHFRIASYKSLPAEKFAEACDYIASLPVKQEALPAPSLLNRRWLVSYDANGKEQVQPVPDDSCVMSLPRLLEAINEPNGMMVETQVLADFAVATIQRIAKRCEYYKTVSQGKPVTLNW